MIPVVMYTAKEGQLHVGQARALGAIGILSKQLRPGELFEVLQGLGLAEERREETSSECADDRKLIADERKESLAETPTASGLGRLDHQHIEQIARATAAYVANSAAQAQERRLLEGHIAQLRQSVSQLRQEVSDLTAEHQQASAKLPGAVADAILAREEPASEAGRRIVGGQRFGSPTAIVLGLLLVVPAALAVGVLLSDADALADNGERDRRINETLGWALSEEGRFRFGDVVFDDRQLQRLQALMARLFRLDFSGTVQMESHLGRPCLIGNRTDGYQVTGGSWPLDACDHLGVSDAEAHEFAALSSDEFMRYVAEHGVDSGKQIRVEIITRGHEAPLYSYPERTTEATAQSWNRAAARNNRVVVSLVSD